MCGGGGLWVIDTYPKLRALRERLRERFDALFNVHMVESGDRAMADIVHDYRIDPQKGTRPGRRRVRGAGR